tara:strand:- start:2161 stop:2367 length:207 start_codon:yes stop_codon:yes gene_type:complete
MKTDFKIADLVTWEADRQTLSEFAIVVDINVPDISDVQNEKYAKVMWNSGNISNVPLKLIYLVNRSSI